jgi:hypothetical protein
MPPAQTPSSAAITSRDLRREAEQAMSARAPRLPGQNAGNGEEGDEPEFQNSVPPIFMRLMISSFVVLLLVMGAVGCWWVQQKPKTTSPTTLDLGQPMPGAGAMPSSLQPKSAD